MIIGIEHLAIASPDPARLAHIHYHGLFSEDSAAANPILDGTLALPAGIREWLEARHLACVPGRADCAIR